VQPPGDHQMNDRREVVLEPDDDALAEAPEFQDASSLELRELPVPEIGPDDALLQVEACGICGSDYEQYPTSVRAEPVEAPVRFPVTIGTPVEPLSREVPRGVARERGRPPRRARVRA